MTETIRARWHRVIGPRICSARGAHRLTLVTIQHYGCADSRNMATGRVAPASPTWSEHRPMCLTCWQHPAD